MSEGRSISDLITQLHQRLGEARESVQTEPRSLEEILSGPASFGRTESAGTVTETPPDQEEVTTEKRSPATPQTAETRPSETDQFTEDQKDDSAARQCRNCGRHFIDGRSAPEDAGLCEECIPQKPQTPPPTTAWQDKTLGKLNDAILDVLYQAYPEELSAPEIADRLPARNIQPEDAEKSEVNSKLYGPLYRWLEKEGETPPLWSLQPVQKSAESAADPYTITESTGRSDKDDDPYSEETSGRSRSKPQKADGAANSQQGLTSDKACPICSEPMDDPYTFRGEQMCENCYEALKDI